MADEVTEPKPDFVERWAMRLAVGNNGGTWDSHYSEKQKAFWRNEAFRLLMECMAEMKEGPIQG